MRHNNTTVVTGATTINNRVVRQLRLRELLTTLFVKSGRAGRLRRNALSSGCSRVRRRSSKHFACLANRSVCPFLFLFTSIAEEGG